MAEPGPLRTRSENSGVSGAASDDPDMPSESGHEFLERFLDNRGRRAPARPGATGAWAHETMLRLAATLHASAEVLEGDRADLHHLRGTGHRELADRYRRTVLQLSTLMYPTAVQPS
jgi:hypothetical protein